MGGGCYRVPSRNLFFIGGHCENGCFRDHGGCEASSQFKAVKSEAHCELKPHNDDPLVASMAEINQAVDNATAEGKSIFLYTPDMFSKTYFDNVFCKLPDRDNSTYIAVNAGVPSLVEKADWPAIRAKGIREIWIGVESACWELREKYYKAEFGNDDVLKVTKAGHDVGINICWFLVDGPEDTEKSRVDTYQLIKEADPFRVHIGTLERYGTV